VNRPVVVIPTKGRPAQAAGVVRQCLGQTAVPSAVVVVDSSDGDAFDALEHDLAALDASARARVVHLRASRASAPGQRNEGIEHAVGLADWTCLQFLDDDVEVDDDFLARSMAGLYAGAWGGVCGVTTDGAWARPVGRRVFERLFCLAPGPAGSLSAAGRNSAFSYDAARTGVFGAQWLLGVSMFRREVVEQVRYWDEQDGYVLFDDVEFSVRVARRWAIGVMPSVRIEHQELSRNAPDDERSAFQMTYNRYRVLRSARSRPGLAFWWSVAGLLLRAAVSAGLGRRSGRLRVRGTLAGVRAIRASRGRA
jgi:GT2 family glycosyltransferase